MEHILTWEMMREYEKHLRLAEKSSSTIQKYLHDIWRFYEHLPRGKVFTKERVIAYKESLAEQYAIGKCDTGGVEWAIFVFRVVRLQSKAVQTATMHFSG